MASNGSASPRPSSVFTEETLQFFNPRLETNEWQEDQPEPNNRTVTQLQTPAGTRRNASKYVKAGRTGQGGGSAGAVFEGNHRRRQRRSLLEEGGRDSSIETRAPPTDAGRRLKEGSDRGHAWGLWERAGGNGSAVTALLLVMKFCCDAAENLNEKTERERENHFPSASHTASPLRFKQTQLGQR